MLLRSNLLFSLALALALMGAPLSTWAQTPTSAPWGALPERILTCRLANGAEICDQNARFPASAATSVRAIFNARMPAAGGLYSDEGISSIRLTVTRHTTGTFTVVVTTPVPDAHPTLWVSLLGAGVRRSYNKRDGRGPSLF